MRGDYDSAARALATAAQTANASPDVKLLADLAKGGARRDQGSQGGALRPCRHSLSGRRCRAGARTRATRWRRLQGAARRPGLRAEIPIRVEFYRSPSDLAAVSSLSQAEVARTGTIALCKWARLMVTTPRALAYGYPWLDSINHELVHYAVSTLTRDRAPVWLQEGWRSSSSAAGASRPAAASRRRWSTCWRRRCTPAS
jgi:hypothetical protein